MKPRIRPRSISHCFLHSALRFDLHVVVCDGSFNNVIGLESPRRQAYDHTVGDYLG